jgi:sugar lactone lactonase YvrE
MAIGFVNFSNCARFFGVSAIGIAITACSDSGRSSGSSPADQIESTHDPDVELPPNWFPESLNAGSDGTIYVGSFASAQIATFKPGDRKATVLVGPGTAKNMSGVLVDDETKTILACTFDVSLGIGNAPSVVHRFSTADGSHKAAYPFPKNSLCNDMTFDHEGNVFIADSTGNIYKLPKDAEDGKSPEVWKTDPILAPVAPAVIGADGIAFDGKNSLFVNTISGNRLLRIPINSDGTAGAIQIIEVTPSLNEPDGMRVIDEKTLVVAEAPAGRVSKIVVDGDSATLTAMDDQLDQPASVVKVGSDLWVSEGQIARFVSNQPPKVPFMVRRVPYER